MRLAFPRIKSLRTDDGAASIAFQMVDMNRDTGGLTYLFRFKTPSGDIEVRAIVAIVTSTPAADKFAESGGDFWSLEMAERDEYIERYAAEYGNAFEVRIFKVPANTSDDSIVVLRDAFCALFFECWSSHKYNNAEGGGNPADCYPDTIHFLPVDLNRKFHVTLQATRGARHD